MHDRSTLTSPLSHRLCDSRTLGLEDLHSLQILSILPIQKQHLERLYCLGSSFDRAAKAILAKPPEVIGLILPKKGTELGLRDRRLTGWKAITETPGSV